MANEATQLQKQAAEQQATLLAYLRQVDQVRIQIQNLATAGRYKTVTLTALEGIPDAPTYKSIGKSYVLCPRDKLTEEIASSIKKSEKHLEKLQELLSSSQSKQKDAEEKLADTLKALQSAMG
ncbi:Prefoldin subunit [Giardia muris]|uniref:Prefoldin subunit n=1 Tax=Giardia muris TaxID=5742 RepID=A0A4Z1SVF0_GIAMU|nr:Prefoldin subunit [Giardia muris]|eukprot:TNJ29852.1 Prefoldin subunit [Giardia muris]